MVVTNTDAQSGTLTNGFTYTTGTGGGGPIAFVQVNAAIPQTATAAVALSYVSPQTAGNLNIVVVGWNDTTSIVTSVSDSRGNTYAQAGGMITGSSACGSRSTTPKTLAAGSNTVTVVFNQAARYVDVRILEYSGLDTSNPLDVTASAAGSSATPNSGAATTTSANELIFGAGTTATGFYAPGSGFTTRIITGDGDIAEDKVVSSTGSYSATGQTSSRALGDADGDLPGRARGRKSGADGERDHADVGNGEWGDGGDHHGHRLPGGSDSQAGRNICDRRDGGEQHIDHGDHPGACGGRSQRGGDEHRTRRAAP